MASTPGTRFRTALLRDLRAINRAVRYLTSDWATPSTVYIPQGEREDPRVYKRARRADEYPESQARELRRTFDQLEELEKLIRSTREDVARRYREVLAEQQGEVK